MLVPFLSSIVLLTPPGSVAPVAAPPAGAPVTLARKFTLGEKLVYKVGAEIRAQQRGGNLDTFLPENAKFSYGFTTEVRKLKTDGIVEMMYSRPTFTLQEDEDFDSGPKTTVEKVDMKALLTVSPINQILEAEDLTPKQPKSKAEGDGDGDGGGNFVLAPESARARQQDQFSQYVMEVHRLALFIGSFDSGMDFNPKLPLDQVKVGDTWKQTVSYEPQKLKGDKEGKQEVQRLDYVFTYKGPMVSQGRQVQRVQASLEFATDLAEFFKQIAPDDDAVKHLTKIPLNFKGTIDFDLDPKTLRTIHADAHSEGGFQLWTTDFPDRAELEENFKGNTTEDLVGVGTAKL